MLQNSRIPCPDSSRPNPDRFTPPNGNAGWDAVIPLTYTLPASRSRTNRSTSASSRVHTFELSPKGESFAISTASSRSLARYSVATGPNASSRWIRISRVMSARTVGG